MGANLWKSECYGLDSERKKVPASSPEALTCVLIHLGAFWSLLAHLPSQKSILPYFSSPRGVAVSVSFPEARIRKETVSGLAWSGLSQLNGGCSCLKLIGVAQAECAECTVTIFAEAEVEAEDL